MMITPPVAAAQAGQASGGGLLSALTGGAAAPSTAAGGDGSVGLFDGVLKKALISGGLGAAMGFIPFIPGGPVLGGIMGAIGGAAMGVFSNWSKMKQIRQQNDATLAAMGVQTGDPQVQQILQSGNVSQLIPYMQQQGMVGQVGQVDQAAAGQYATQQTPLPTQAVAYAGGGETSAAAAATQTAPVSTDPARLTSAQLAAMIQTLQAQLDQMRAYLEIQQQREEAETELLAS